MSEHFKSRNPSAIRLAQIEFMKREDECEAINAAIGNVTLPMHPAMIKRMANLLDRDSPFRDGAVTYSATRGTAEANKAVLNIIASSGFETKGLHTQIIDGGSQAMELVIVGCCGPAGSDKRPLLLIDPAYTNYVSFAQRLGRKTVTVKRKLEDDGTFSLPSMAEIEKIIEKHKPGAIVVIPYDNPTGQFFQREQMVQIAKLCAKHDMWFISDEAYRELNYSKFETVSIWGITNKDAKGIEGRRISIETASKVFNACGLRIGAIVSDNEEFVEKSVAEYTANLCANAIGQHIYAGLGEVSAAELQRWYGQQRAYYRKMILETSEELKHLMPGIIISRPDASIYSVIDVRKIAKKSFDAREFVMWCAQKGKAAVGGKNLTLLVSPMGGFYDVAPGEENPGKTQMRIAYVEPPVKMRLVPALFCKLFKQYMGENPAKCECDGECKLAVRKKIEQIYSEN